ncbi:hypothetical protein GWK47_051420 [Chionoecetes opilio]|uniref:Uncharacterized protein n=1 Tax=Chionoecetes opilio TaxID=41210 RepID=A0A8J4Y847_CHIOP|nr:hypothetical protein GWK47_051420 [Chionoecetes opilio]
MTWQVRSPSSCWPTLTIDGMAQDIPDRWSKLDVYLCGPSVFLIRFFLCRLGLFLFTRILKTGRDRRFKEALERPSLMFVFWTMQGAWVILTLLPSLLAVRATRQAPLSLRDYAGWGLWTVGFLVEVLADYQKTVFRNDAANKQPNASLLAAIYRRLGRTCLIHTCLRLVIVSH